jgi:drug/metabolite transporter (DMT)-like permease
LLVGVVFLSVMMIGRKWVKPTGSEWLLIAGYGALWLGAYNVTLTIAEQTLDAGTAAMLVNIAPILIAVGAGVLLREGIPKWLAIGGGIAVIGVILIGMGSGGTEFTDGSGMFWCLLAAVLYAAGVLCQKPALRRLPSAQITWLGCVVGVVFCLPFTGDLIAELHTAPLGSILGVAYLGAVPTAIAFSTWSYALARIPAGQLGISTYIVAPLTIGLGFLVFREVPTLLAIIGGAVCLVGVAVAQRRSGTKRDSEHLVNGASRNLTQ